MPFISLNYSSRTDCANSVRREAIVEDSGERAKIAITPKGASNMTILNSVLIRKGEVDQGFGYGEGRGPESRALKTVRSTSPQAG